MATGIFFIVAILLALVLASLGFLIGYFMGRSADRREAQRGFPVLTREDDPHDKR